MSPEAYGLQELRLIQQYFLTSAADATALDLTTVPAGKIWTVLAIGYYPSVNETQTVMITKVLANGRVVSIMNPQSVALQPMLFGLDQGLTVQLYPGENLRIRRGAATAGSTMSCTMQYVESDLPLYFYVEPQEEKRIRQAALQAAGEAARMGRASLNIGAIKGMASRIGKGESKR